MPALTDIRIIFMGTPDFAVPTLKALIEQGLNVVAVVTAPDKPAGRGMQLQKSAVGQYAQQAGLLLLQPEKLRDPQFIRELERLKADLQIVVAFRMLPELVWNMPPMGTVNLHASLLPAYRGAAPINWAVINGETMTGITTFKLQHAIDTGNILLQEELPISETENAGSVHDRMQEAGAKLVLETVKGLADGTLKEHPQKESGSLKAAPKIFKETCRIDFNQSVATVYNLIRGLAPFPTAYTELEGKTLKVFEAHKELSSEPVTVGGVQTDGSTYLKFGCKDGYIVLDQIQLAGKKRMQIKDFLRGYRFESNS